MKKFLKDNYIKLITLLIAGIVLVWAIISAFSFKMENTKIGITKADSYEDGWYYYKNNQKTELTEVSREVMNNNGEIKIYHVLPDIMNEDECIMIITKNEKVKAVVEDHIMYEYGYNVDSPFASPSGAIRNIIELTRDCESKVIEITLTPTKGNIGNSKYDIYIGTIDEMFLTIFSTNFLLIIICILLFASSLFFVIQGIIFYSQDKDHNKAMREIHFGAFLFLAATWCTTDGLLLQLFTKNKMISYMLFNTSFLLLPIPFALSCGKVFSKQKKVYETYALVAAIYFVIRMVLYATGVLDFEQYLSIIHMMMAFLIIFTIYLCVKEFEKYSAKYLLFALIALGITEAISLTIFWLNNSLKNQRFNYATGFYIGIFIFMLIYTIGFIKDNRMIFEQATKSQYYELCAHQDRLTELGNRALFEEELDDIDNNMNSIMSLSMIMFDLNNLKSTNDKLGHDIGDELLIATANEIKKIFDSVGKVFRIGGDEIVVIIKDKNYDEVFDYLTTFHKNIDEYNQYNEVKIDVAIGCAIETDFTLVDGKSRVILRHADVDMYNNKEAIKKYNNQELDKRI